MNNSPPSRARSVLFPIVALILCGMVTSMAKAQSDDPYFTAPEKRRKASLPLAYGVIVNGSYPLYKSSLSSEYDDLVEKNFRGGVNLYYDTWQIGYNMRQQGNVFSLMTRTSQRDVYSGLYLEIGSFTTTMMLGDSTTGEVSRSVYGGGVRGTIGLNKSKSVLYVGDISFGTTNSDVGTLIYFAMENGVRARIPISSTALQIGLNAELGILPPARAYPVTAQESDVVFGINVDAGFAFNLDMN